VERTSRSNAQVGRTHAFNPTPTPPTVLGVYGFYGLEFQGERCTLIDWQVVRPWETIVSQRLTRTRGDVIAGSIHNEYDFGVSKDGYKTIIYLKFIYTLKIDQNIRQNSIRSYS